MDKKELIKKKALQIFRERGDITAREVASLAGVNVAAINYYYRNKDNLISELLEVIMGELDERMLFFKMPTISLEDTKNKFAKELYAFAINSPGFFKFILKIVVGGNTNVPAFEKHYGLYFGTVRAFVEEVIHKFSSITNSKEIEIRIDIFMTSLSVSLITADAVMREESQIKPSIQVFKDEDYFISYINMLIDLVLIR